MAIGHMDDFAVQALREIYYAEHQFLEGQQEIDQQEARECCLMRTLLRREGVQEYSASFDATAFSTTTANSVILSALGPLPTPKLRGNRGAGPLALLFSPKGLRLGAPAFGVGIKRHFWVQTSPLKHPGPSFRP